MITTILQWIGSLLKWLDEITGSYMIALFIFALIVEVLMLPLGIYQQKNSIKQARMRPKEMAIKKKYAGRDDRNSMQKMQQEIQAMYQKENFSQTAGCLPLLLQFPIIIALYQVVINPLLYVMRMSTDAISAVGAYITSAAADGGLGLTVSARGGTMEYIGILNNSGIGAFEGLVDFVDGGSVESIKDLAGNGASYFEELSSAFEAGLPNFNFFSMNLAKTPWSSFAVHETIGDWMLLLIPIFTFVIYYFSLKLTRKFTYQAPTAQDAAMGCSNKVMDIAMPGMSTYFAFILPAAVGIYWVFKSILGTIKQFVMTKVMPLPRFTEEDYKEAERELAGKAKRVRSKRQGTDAALGTTSDDRPRSLHHIDDEDETYKETVASTPTEYIREHGTELSKKSPYYDGIDADDNSENNSEEASNDISGENIENKDSSSDVSETKAGGAGLIERSPLKDDKKSEKNKKKEKK